MPEKKWVPVSISIPRKLFDKIEETRGLIARSTYIVEKLEEVMKDDKR